MKKIISISTIAMFAMVLGMGSVLPALPHASADADCGIGSLKESTEDISKFTGRNNVKDLSGLLAKLDMASDKLANEKIQNAIDKIEDYIEKVGKLEKAGKIDSDFKEVLLNGPEPNAYDVRICLVDRL